MVDKQSKNARVLDLYERLCAGKVINKAEESRRFGVDERSIQRDIDDIRAFLDERAVADAGDTRWVIYDRQKKGFLMSGYQSPLMTNSEILAVSKYCWRAGPLRKRKCPRFWINSLLDVFRQKYEIGLGPPSK